VIKKIPAWVWAVIVGVLWALAWAWRGYWSARQLARLETERRLAADAYTKKLEELDAGADVERLKIVAERREADVRADFARAQIMEAASKDQQAFATHWAKVMGKKP
jgi:hypothetical protein